VQAGSVAWMHFGSRATTRSLKVLLALVLFAVAGLMSYRSLQ